MKTIKLIIADDHKIVTEGVGFALGQYDDIDLVHSTPNGKELIECLAEKKPEVILLDIRMPDMDGFEALDYIRLNHPHIKVIMFSMYDDEYMVTKAKERGANGFLEKSTTVESLYKAICKVVEGTNYYLPASGYGKNLGVTSKKSGKAVQLSDTQKQIINFTVQGLTHAQIAEELHLSKRTIDNNKSRLLKKLELKNEKDLIAFAFKNGLI